MGFDEEDRESEEKQPIRLFGLEVSSGVAYGILAILTLIFIRQVYVVLQALN